MFKVGSALYYSMANLAMEWYSAQPR